jgi:hypothetical protein
MFAGDDFDRLINEAIDDKPRQRRAETAALLRALAEVLEQKFRSRVEFRTQYDQAARLARTGEHRAALREYEGNYDGAEDTDILTGVWLRRLGNLPSALEPTIAAVLEAVVLCDDPDDVVSALKHFDAAAAKDKKIHTARGRQLIAEYPPYGKPAYEDKNSVDFVALGKAREKHERSGK